MDTSKTYIKQCEKAEEIQKLDKYEDGNYYAFNLSAPSMESEYNVRVIVHQRLPSLLYKGIVEWAHISGCDGRIWLPRQDQLQEMMELPNNFKIFHPIAVNSKYRIMWGCNFVDGDSMEQLWLSFVMSEKYSKQWDPEKEEWIK